MLFTTGRDDQNFSTDRLRVQRVNQEESRGGWIIDKLRLCNSKVECAARSESPPRFQLSQKALTILFEQKVWLKTGAFFQTLENFLCI